MGFIKTFSKTVRLAFRQLGSQQLSVGHQIFTSVKSRLPKLIVLGQSPPLHVSSELSHASVK